MKLKLFLLFLVALTLPTGVNADHLGNNSFLVGIYLTREGLHAVGGPGCQGDYSATGSMADCGGGRCFGNQVLCTKNTSLFELSPDTKVVVDAYFTEQGLHAVGGPGCAPSYDISGSVADCGGGRCNGNQLLCVRAVEARALRLFDPAVARQVWLGREGAHQDTGYCPDGFQVRNSIADCGGGQCYGNQLFCSYGRSVLGR